MVLKLDAASNTERITFAKDDKKTLVVDLKGNLERYLM